MQDISIVDLFWQRNQAAITECELKYGKTLHYTSYSILSSNEDAEECVQDTYVAAWNSMPTDRPQYLGAYLMKIIRNLSINRYRRQNAQKRNAGQTLVYDELCECIPDKEGTVFDTMEKGALAKLIDRFLEGLDKEKRIVFVRRYFYSDSVKNISKSLGISESKVKSMLMRMRMQLAKAIKEAGYYE